MATVSAAVWANLTQWVEESPRLESGRLGALLVQFPWFFRNEPENRIYLRRLRDSLCRIPAGGRGAAGLLDRA
jgi:uncharacterized protein YecE (DUF72 family)